MGRVKFSTQLQERTWDDFCRRPVNNTVALKVDFFFFSSSGAKYANFSSPSNRHATRRLSIDQSEWLTWFAVTHLEFLTILPSPKPTQICVISKFHRLDSERVDIYTPTALGSSDQTSEFLMRKVLVSGNKYLTAGGLQKKVNHFNPFTAIFLLSLSVALFSFIFLAYRADNDYQCSQWNSPERGH